MVNALQGMTYIQQQGELGRQRGQERFVNRLAPQILAGDPAAFQQAAAVDPAAAQTLQSAGDGQLRRMRGFVQFIDNARSTGDPAKISAALRAAGPYLAPMLGDRPPPTEWTPDMDAGWETLKARIAGADAGTAGNTVQSQKVGADGFIYNTMRDGTIVNTGVQADRQMWFRDHPGMAPELVGKDGVVRPVGQGAAPAGMPAAPGSAAAPLPQGGSQAYVDDALALANQMIAAGIPAEQVDAFVRARMNPDPAAAAAAPMVAPVAQARPSEAQTAAATEAARLGVQMQYAPAQAALETQAAVDRAARLAPIETAAAVERQQAEAGVAAQTEQAKKQREQSTVFAQYQAAISGLRQGLANATTGPIAGRLPALTADAQIAEGSVAALAPVLKQLFRAAGEGTFTDRDQALLLEMVPTRTDLPAAREAKLQNIDNIVRAKLGQGGMYGAAPPDGPPTGNQFQNTSRVVDGPAAAPVRRARNPQTGQVLVLRNGQWVPE